MKQPYIWNDQPASPSEGAPREPAGPLPVVGSGGVVGPLAARHWKAPFRYDAEGSMIWDANNERALDVRGWGRLTGGGEHSLGLSYEAAAKIQDEFGQSVVQILNAQWPNKPDEERAAGRNS